MENKEKIERGVRMLLEAIGENPDREGLLGTPDRIARMYAEIFRGYDKAQSPRITTFRNGNDGIIYTNAIYDTGTYYSMCEHHMMPFFGTYTFVYVPAPSGKLLGLSKIGRVVDYCSARLQLQERLCHDIVSMIDEELKRGEPEENWPLGVAISMCGQHLCKSMRGARKEGRMSCDYVTGVFTEPARHSEFLAFARTQQQA